MKSWRANFRKCDSVVWAICTEVTLALPMSWSVMNPDAPSNDQQDIWGSRTAMGPAQWMVVELLPHQFHQLLPSLLKVGEVNSSTVEAPSDQTVRSRGSLSAGEANPSVVHRPSEQVREGNVENCGFAV